MPPPMTTTSKRRPAFERSSVQVDRRPLGGGALGGQPPLLTGAAEVEKADEALPVGEADGGPALGVSQQRRGAPVAGVTPGVGAEQDDVGGDRRRVQVLL